MDAFLQQFQDLKIQLEEITSATNNFDQNNYIGHGGFGKVYKGEVSHFRGRNMAAIKRLDSKHGQGIPEFLKEITTLSRFSHENIISLLGFCYQGDEMILVYEHASHGSLDRHLNSPHLTWSQRLNICLEAANGLRYLHDPRDTHQRLIHCDIKSANILLDKQWSAKLSDLGLSIMGPANEKQSVIVTPAAGTLGYCDPQYAMTHTLTKESDVYSFGVVLFEVLCGTLCSTYRNGHVENILVPSWIESYKQNKLNDIIFKNPTIQPLDQNALETFSDIAYRCLKESPDDRPHMSKVVTELETSLAIQELSEGNVGFDYKEITKTAEPPMNYRSRIDLKKLLSKGVLLNGRKTWLSLNKKGEHCEMISFADCLDSEFMSNSQFSHFNSRFAVGTYPYQNHEPIKTRRSSLHKTGQHYGKILFEREYNSRFPLGTYYSRDGILKTRVKAQFLSPGIPYTVNLVFKAKFNKKCIVGETRKCQHITLTYKLEGETKTSISYLAYERDDGWWACELYQFNSDQGTADLEILFDGFSEHVSLNIEGIEFRPLKKVEYTDAKQPISYSDANWEEKLPSDYEDIMKWSTNNVQWTTKKEAYSIICKGFIIDDGDKWFSLDKNGKKCLMVSATTAIWHGAQPTLPESRLFYIFRDNGSFKPHYICFRNYRCT